MVEGTDNTVVEAMTAASTDTTPATLKVAQTAIIKAGDSTKDQKDHLPAPGPER